CLAAGHGPALRGGFGAGCMAALAAWLTVVALPRNHDGACASKGLCRLADGGRHGAGRDCLPHGGAAPQSATDQKRDGNHMMSVCIIAGIAFALMFGLMAIGMPIAFAMLIVGIGGMGLLLGIGPALGMLGQLPYNSAASYELSVVPMFVLMGV